MFTLKFCTINPDTGSRSYRCVAAQEFEVSPIPAADGWSIYWTDLNNRGFDWKINKPNEELIVENAAGKTIDRIRYNAPLAPISGTAPADLPYIGDGAPT